MRSGRKEAPSSVTAYAVPPSPRRGEGFGGGWKPPLRDVFGLCVGAHIVRPPVSHRPPLFCQDRRDPLVGYARQFNTPAAAAQTGEPGVVHHPRRTRAPCQRPASPVSGGRGKADCGTQAERMWSRGPAGSVTLRRFAYFAAWGKVGRPAGRNPLEAETVGWKEDPSSVTAYAVTPSPLWGEGFECASWGRPCAENPALSRQHRTMTSA